MGSVASSETSGCFTTITNPRHGDIFVPESLKKEQFDILGKYAFSLSCWDLHDKFWNHEGDKNTRAISILSSSSQQES